MMKFIKTTAYFAVLLLMTACQFFQAKSVASPKNNSINIAVATPTAMPAPSVVAEKTEDESKSPAESLKPKNQFVLAEASGDLNGDGRDDLIAAYSQDNPQTEKRKVKDADGEAERLFVVALQNPVGTYEQIFSGSKIILCRNCGGMNDNVVPDLKITDRKIYVDQNVLATSEVDFHLEIELKNENDLVITKGTVENRDRRAVETRKQTIKTPLPLGLFDVHNY